MGNETAKKKASKVAVDNGGPKKLPKITILYEDADCLVIDKPAGIMVHGDGRAKGPFVTDWIMEHFPLTEKVGDPMNGVDGEPQNRAGIVHRLDRDTTGVLLIAKTAAGHASLKKQFQERTIKKKYVAFVWGQMKEEFGTIDRPIGRSSTDFRKWSAQRGTRGETREAETYWTLLGKGQWKGGVDGMEDKFSFVEAEPKTGRTHQIRVHMLAIQHPVVGDALYAENRPMALGFERLALHSRAIEFDTLEGKRVKVESPLPADFVRACKELGVSVDMVGDQGRSNRGK